MSDSSNEFSLELFLKNLPHLPGVYRMLDKSGQVLYVGKAVSLKNRVKSYFSQTAHSPRIALMVRQIARIETTVTRSESEALILENNLIKSLSPKYNILFRDDKSYPYILFSAHRFSRIAYHRGALKAPNRYFGPFPDSQVLRDSLEMLQKAFCLRTCQDSVFAHRDRPCLLHQIRRCSAPCTGEISAEDYQQDVESALDFLNGKTDDITRKIQQEMTLAAEALDFERAALLRDRLHALSAVRSKQFIDASEKVRDIDVLALAHDDSSMCIHMVSFRAGRRVLDKSFFPQYNACDVDEATQAFVAQRYLGCEKPNIIIGNFVLPEVLMNALQHESARKITWIHHPRGERKVWLDMATKNAVLNLSQHTQNSGIQHMRRQALADLLGLSHINRIECFDISHTQGENTVASCVVYEDNAMQHAQYRIFNIHSTDIGDDYAAMREVLMRRYCQLEGAFPDIVVVDGGKGQMSTARDVWNELGLTIPLMGIAKGPERKEGDEDLILPNGRLIHPGAHHPALQLLMMVRDEAHRFAITRHRKKRDKSRMGSVLDEIAGVGAKRRRALIARFGSVRAMKGAAVEDIAQVDGISHALAQKIYDALQK